MENAADALKIAFAMFVFVVAITVTFSLVSQAKSTADVVLYHSDETNFYEKLDSGEFNREVSISEIIPTLYRYYKESVGVTVNLKEPDGRYETYTFDLNNNETILLENKKKLNSEADREANLEKFINDILFNLSEDTRFEEKFVEVPISGKYEYGSDGTELVLSSGGKKVYITYTETEQ